MRKGRPKGYSPCTDITYEELGDWLGRKSLVKVSKAWLEDLTNHAVSIEQASETLTSLDKPQSFDPPQKEEVEIEQPKIEFKLTDLNYE